MNERASSTSRQHSLSVHLGGSTIRFPLFASTRPPLPNSRTIALTLSTAFGLANCRQLSRGTWESIASSSPLSR
jgi:hypothetical protein